MYEEPILKIVMEDQARSAADFYQINDLIREKNLSYRGNFVTTLAVPKVISDDIYNTICAFIEKTFLLLNRIIEQYMSDAEYRKLFGFAPELEEMILASQPRNGWIPLARIDFFLNEETGEIKMCEINTDGTSGMNEDGLLSDWLEHNSAFQTFMRDKEYRCFELFDSWAEEFLTVYRNFKGGTTRPPRVAIVDFLDVGYVTEFERFKETFIRHGMVTEICDIRELSYSRGKLRTPSGMSIDAIYRRAVTSDVMKHEQEIGPFLRAVKERSVCLIGDFATQIVHNKRLFFILFHPATKAFLTKEEIAFVEKHFPATYPLTSENIKKNAVYKNREEWLIKPSDSYGAKGVYAGKKCTDEEWQQYCGQFLYDDYILQRFHPPYKTPNINFTASDAQGSPQICEFSNLMGVFCYNGKPYGLYSRMASGEIISTQYDEKTIATVLLHG
jgi:glutathionylspermidine synthase